MAVTLGGFHSSFGSISTIVPFGCLVLLRNPMARTKGKNEDGFRSVTFCFSTKRLGHIPQCERRVSSGLYHVHPPFCSEKQLLFSFGWFLFCFSPLFFRLLLTLLLFSFCSHFLCFFLLTYLFLHYHPLHYLLACFIYPLSCC